MQFIVPINFLRVLLRYVLFITTLLFFLSTQVLYAQYHKLDSLKTKLQNHPQKDITHLKLLNELAEEYKWNQHDSANVFSERAYLLAQQLNNKEEYIKALNNQVSSLFRQGSKEQALALTQKAIDKNKNPVNSKQLILSYIYLVDIYTAFGNDSLARNALKKTFQLCDTVQYKLEYGLAQFSYGIYKRDLGFHTDSAKECFTTAIRYFEMAEDLSWLSYTLLAKGMCFLYESQYDSALYYIQKSAETAAKVQCNVCLANSYAGEASIWHLGKSNYPKAIEKLLQSVRYAEQAGNNILLAYNLNNIATILNEMEQYDKAIYYLNKQLPVSKLLNDAYSLAGYYEEYGNAYFKQNKFKEALQQYLLGLHLGLEINNKGRICGMSNHVGDAYEGLQQYDSAFYYFKKAMEAGEQIGSKYDIIVSLTSMARTLMNMPAQLIRGEIKKILFTQDKNALALQYAEEALRMADSTGEPLLKRNLYKVLSELHGQTNNLAKSYGYYKQYVMYEDSISGIQNAKVVAYLQAQYESEKQQQQIASLQKDNALHQSEIQKQKTQRNILMGGCALVLVLMGFVVNGYIAKTKANKEIEKTYTHLQTSQQQLVQQGKLVALAKMTSDVAQRIKEPIGKIKTLSPQGQLLVREYEAATDEEEKNNILKKIKEQLTEINSSGVLANDVVKDVLMQTRKQTAVP